MPLMPQGGHQTASHGEAHLSAVCHLLPHTPRTSEPPHLCAGSVRVTQRVWILPQMVARSSASERCHSHAPPRMDQLEEVSRCRLPSERMVEADSTVAKSALRARQRRCWRMGAEPPTAASSPLASPPRPRPPVAQSNDSRSRQKAGGHWEMNAPAPPAK